MFRSMGGKLGRLRETQIVMVSKKSMYVSDDRSFSEQDAVGTAG